MFLELSSSPATMEAARVADLIGMTPGYVTQIADAKQAYTQAKLGGEETYVFLPEDQIPKDWKTKFPDLKRPVCKLNLALYGHPNAGAYWEQHCDKHMRNIGFVPIDEGDAWRWCLTLLLRRPPCGHLRARGGEEHPYGSNSSSAQLLRASFWPRACLGSA